jgi:arginase
MLKDFKTIIAECKYGQTIDGVQYGGSLLAKTFDLKPKSTINVSWFTELNCVSNNGYKSTSLNIQQAHTYNMKTLLLGGDHSISISSIDAMLNIYGDDLRILWIDAHADINDYDSSLSGNIHGMPLGFHFVGTRNIIPWNKEQRRLKPHQLYYLGIRDLDEFEKNLITQYDIKYSHNIDDQLINFMKSASKLMISFDVDSLDPCFVSATGTKANDGLHPLTLKAVFNNAREYGNLVHIDITELNPLLGDINVSIESIKSIFI